MARTAVLGFPRIEADRELKLALEVHWAGGSSLDELQAVARRLRSANLDSAERAGIDVIPVGDFALYDQTRGWRETRAALRNLVEVARRRRVAPQMDAGAAG